MAYVTTKGIVIKTVNIGEADKIITLLSEDLGKIQTSAKGARRPRSNFVAGSQFLCYCEYTLFKGRDMYLLNSCDVIESFYNIRNDIYRLTYASHMVEIINDIVQENMKSSDLLRLFLNTLHYLAYTDKSPELITRIFELRALALSGFAPQVDGCIRCGKEINTIDHFLFDFRDCRFVCSDCQMSEGEEIRISKGTAKALFYIVYAVEKELFNFELAPNILSELGAFNERYLVDRLEKSYKKLNFLKKLKK
ncbi:MAG: DNA repair protein RecO [Bacteroidales bacterium]|nr:DNA repair protein RecO [Bacteroidales bacterium]